MEAVLLFRALPGAPLSAFMVPEGCCGLGSLPPWLDLTRVSIRESGWIDATVFHPLHALALV